MYVWWRHERVLAVVAPCTCVGCGGAMSGCWSTHGGCVALRVRSLIVHDRRGPIDGLFIGFSCVLLLSPSSLRRYLNVLP